MTDREEILVNRVGCVAHAILSFIKSNPEINSRLFIAKRLNVDVKTIRKTAHVLIDMDVITEETTERIGNRWNKKFSINNETEWRL